MANKRKEKLESKEKATIMKTTTEGVEIIGQIVPKNSKNQLTEKRSNGSMYAPYVDEKTEAKRKKAREKAARRRQRARDA